jgi:cytoskeleton protein RodZ
MTDFGGRLRQAREERGISLRQIAANTKISVGALEALERNNVSKLPGGIFSRAFVRSYAAEVGLDPEATVREFLERFDNEPAPERHVHVPVSDVEQSFENRQRAALLAVKAIVGLVVVAAVATYLVVKGRKNSGETTAVAAPATQAPQAPAPAPVPAPVTAPNAAPVPASGPMRLEVHPTDRCWVRLVVDGALVFAREMSAGERQTVTVRETAMIDVGDAAAFAFTVDGRAGKPLGTTGKVTSLRLTRATLKDYLR